MTSHNRLAELERKFHYGWHLRRFVDAQDAPGDGLGTMYEQALNELYIGQKQTHWIWFIFPQMKGLGQSAMSKRFAIKSVTEARAYLEHPVLGPRLINCVQTLLPHLRVRPPGDVFGSNLDGRKFRSSMQLFLAADGGRLFDGSLFDEALRANGRVDDLSARYLSPEGQ